MSIKDLKFETADFSGKDISSLPDRPGDSGITGQQLKARFDQIPKIMLALGVHNDLIDELTGSGGAENIGIAPIEGVSGSNAQEALAEMGALTKAARNAADAATAQGNAAENAALMANEAAENAAEKATAAENATVAAIEAANEASQAAAAATTAIIEVKSYAEEQAKSAKDYVDQVILEGGAVTSVFGRAGEVTAQRGDYTAEMVGARPDSWMPTANEVGARASDWIPSAAEVGAIVDANGAVTSEKLANGAVTSEKLADGAVTPGSIGAVNKAGDTMTGSTLWLNNGYARLLGNANSSSLATYDSAKAPSNRRILDLGNRTNKPNLAGALILSDYIDDAAKHYLIYGDHNKPSGTYTGNGSATERVIHTGGVGDYAIITTLNNIILVGPYAAVGFNPSLKDVAYFPNPELYVENGDIKMATNSARVNSSGASYNYKML